MITNRKPLEAGAAEGLGLQGANQQQSHSTPLSPTSQASCGNSAEAQRQRLLAAIHQRGSISTLEARRPDLDIMAPAARIMELRKKGEPILTVRVPEV